MDHPLYSSRLLDHFHRPRNVGEVVQADAEGRVVSPVHGDTLRLTFALEGERIARVRFQCSGCVVAIAAGSVATTLLEGRSVAEALRIDDGSVAEALGGVPEERRECSLLVGRAVRAALARAPGAGNCS